MSNLCFISVTGSDKVTTHKDNGSAGILAVCKMISVRQKYFVLLHSAQALWVQLPWDSNRSWSFVVEQDCSLAFCMQSVRSK